MIKGRKPGRFYFIINIDEPYAEEIYEILKKGQIAQNKWPEGDITFEEWKKRITSETINAQINNLASVISKSAFEVAEGMESSGVDQKFIDAFKIGIVETIQQAFEDINII